jgi:hypothetical protein
MKKLVIQIIAFGVLFLCIGLYVATISGSKDTQEVDSRFKQCQDPRPEMCTKDYRPVCAIINTTVLCVTDDCPLIKEVTYSNGCTACSDSKVIKFKPGACKE